MVAAEVDAGEDGGEPGEGQRHDPEVGPGAGGAGGARERRVGHPAELRRAPGHEEGHQHGDGPGQVEPVAQRVEAREGHVGRADLQRHDVVGQATEGERAGEQVQHQAAVHGEERVELREAQQRGVRRGQLQPHEQGHDPREVEDGDGGDHVAQPDDLVVGRGQPLEDAGGPVVLVPAVARLVAVAGDRGRQVELFVLLDARWGDDVSHRRAHLLYCRCSRCPSCRNCQSSWAPCRSGWHAGRPGAGRWTRGGPSGRRGSVRSHTRVRGGGHGAHVEEHDGVVQARTAGCTGRGRRRRAAR